MLSPLEWARVSSCAAPVFTRQGSLVRAQPRPPALAMVSIERRVHVAELHVPIAQVRSAQAGTDVQEPRPDAVLQAEQRAAALQLAEPRRGQHQAGLARGLRVQVAHEALAMGRLQPEALVQRPSGSGSPLPVDTEAWPARTAAPGGPGTGGRKGCRLSPFRIPDTGFR